MLFRSAARESAGAANATFKYIDTILKRWHELGVDSLEAGEAAIRDWQTERQERQKQSSVASDRGTGRQSARRVEKDRGHSPWDGYAFEGDGEEP